MFCAVDQAGYSSGFSSAR